MALLDILKKKEIKEVREKKIEKPKIKKPSLRVSSLAWKILKEPHISEKATDLTKDNKYIFRVFHNANKLEIKKAVENVYNVDVLDVNIINVPKKPKRRGRVAGFKKGYKKAVVKIKKGQKIELLPR